MSYPAMPPMPARAATYPPARAAAGYGAPSAMPAARYREAELLSATPGQLVVMLFDKMLLTLRRARMAMEAGEIEQRTTQILSAIDMVTELRVSLDHDQGGFISRNLDALYLFMAQELHAANRHRDVKRIDVVLKIATELREAFAGAQQQLAAAAPADARIA
jgi:flagellar protein FliS